jgi:hypothetical protein
VRGFRPARAIIRELIYGAEPVGLATASKLQTYSAGQLDGSRLGGLPHVNMKGDAGVTFLGYVASPQNFQGNAQMGANRHPTVQEYPALPSDTQPADAPTWFRDWSSTEAVLS